MLRGRFLSVVLLLFLVFTPALASEEEELPQCPVTSASRTDDDDDSDGDDQPTPCIQPLELEPTEEEEPVALSSDEDDTSALAGIRRLYVYRFVQLFTNY